MIFDYSKMAFPKGSKMTKNKKKESVSKITYEKVFKACKGKCVLCGGTQSLELHHINGRGKNLTDNPQNCVMLCQNCHHNVVHKNQKKYRPILIKMREEQEHE